jgi:hypothetical protein
LDAGVLDAGFLDTDAGFLGAGFSDSDTGFLGAGFSDADAGFLGAGFLDADAGFGDAEVSEFSFADGGNLDAGLSVVVEKKVEGAQGREDSTGRKLALVGVLISLIYNLRITA